MRGRLLLVFIVAALLAAAGCAYSPLSPPSEDVRASLGRIGVLSETSSTSGEWNMPAKGGWNGAGRAAPLAAAGAVIAGAESGHPLGFVLGLLLAPLAAVGGGIYGAVGAEPSAVVTEAEATIQAVFADLQIPNTLRDRIVQVARAETRHTVVPQTDAAGGGGPENRPERLAEAIDTILQVSVQGYGTRAAWDIKPPVSLFLAADVRLVRVADGTVLYSQRLHWVSPERPLAEWAAGQGKLARQKLERAIQNLGERIAELVFVLWAVP